MHGQTRRDVQTRFDSNFEINYEEHMADCSDF